MARNKTLYLYNDTKRAQEWTIYSEGIIREAYKMGQTRKSLTISLSSNATIKFEVDGAVYLTATYAYITGSWTSHTDTPKEISCAASQSAVNVTSGYAPE
ncbi:hypothetical protein BCF11_4480 [Collimonas sp. PA-H2]|uniref:hypothetical protein n=1 Tax=Collimonas sp. PA-H2 TaxID=1881062 RepID=UPI000BFA6F27|nr:hypothetical protein [Collimonas sp. PA-H2]PFH12007.1 hypothetical protein BCF11_4480 [Collimonas sp. PA-H2]